MVKIINWESDNHINIKKNVAQQYSEIVQSCHYHRFPSPGMENHELGKIRGCALP